MNVHVNIQLKVVISCTHVQEAIKFDHSTSDINTQHEHWKHNITKLQAQFLLHHTSELTGSWAGGMGPFHCLFSFPV